ncbi:MAG: heavy metal translocating P-type ATPase [Gemmatimonadaceae bacterium]
MSFPDTSIAVTEPVGRVDTLCSHCGLVVPAGLVEDHTERQFCCSGCRAAFDILHAHGLDRFYDLPERRGEAVRSTHRGYEEFDHPTFRDLYVRPISGGLAEVELYLEGVHCASCVWLVERVPLIVEGVSRAELESKRSLARVTWNPATVPLSRVARALDSLGYPPHPFRGVERETMRRKEDRAMLARIGLAGAVAANVMLASFALYSGASGSLEPQYEKFFRWVALAVVTPSMLWPGRVFFAGAWSALRSRTLHMDVPIALGLAAGYVRGVINTVNDSGPVYFDGLAMLVFALLVGRYLQQRGQRAAADGAELLYSLTPSRARTIDANGDTRDIPSEAIVPGMILSVHPGETFPADGSIHRGESQLDLSLLTGESRPVSASVGVQVYAGTLNVSAPLEVRVDKAGETTRVAKILKQVEESAARRAPIVETANRLASWFVAVVLVLAAITFVVWHRIDPSQAVDNAIALLVVTCPCALALSTPLAVSMAIGGAAKAGIFIKGGDALERLAKPGQMFLDKTGTITEGRTAIVSWTGAEWVKPLVLALEQDSHHPIAAGFRASWPDTHAEAVTESNHVRGGGIVGLVAGRRVTIGSPRFVKTQIRPANSLSAFDVDPSLTPVLVAVDGELVAAAGLGDPIRPDAAAAVDALRSRGWTVNVLSGDVPSVALAAGRALGLPDDACVGGASPEDKLAVVEHAHQRLGASVPVVMVGDGINDAAAIAAASVGIGVHGGAEACLSTADIYLTTPGLTPLVRLVRGAERAMGIIKRNIAFSVVYNIIGAGLAMTGHLSPIVAALLMPASSLTVVIASWRGQAFRGASL